MTASTNLRRLVTITGLIVGVLVLAGGTAFAHVSVSPGTAAPGSYPTLTFRVPNEESAGVTQVEIQIPAGTPFAEVMAEQKPGWTTTFTTTRLPAVITQGAITFDKAITSVTFTADGAGLAPDEYATFEVMVGPVPDVAQISFIALQTYSDGTVVSWSDPPTASGAEPAHPAPVLTVTGPPVTGDDAAVASVTAATTAGAAAAAGPTDGLARAIAVIGIMVGAIGIGVGLTGRRKGPLPTAAGNFTALPGFQVPGDPPPAWEAGQAPPRPGSEA